MPVPCFTYQISHLPGLEGAAKQAVASADRPLCALTAALASMQAGQKLSGQALGWTEPQIAAAFGAAFAELNVPPTRADLWAQSLNGRRLNADAKDINGVELSEYQLQALRTLTVAGGVFALDMGLGKTLTSIAAALLYRVLGLADKSRCWIVCPLNAMGAWAPFVPLLKEHYEEVRVLSVDSAHKYSAAAPTGGTVIYDEVHMLGATGSRRTLHCHLLRRGFDVGICNTGTLLHAGVEKVLSILDLAVPGAAGFATRWKCGEHFKCLVHKQIGSRKVTELAKPAKDQEENIAKWIGHYTTILDTDSPSVQDCVTIPPQHDTREILGQPWLSLDDAFVDEVEKDLAAGLPLPEAAEIAHRLARAGIDAKLDWFSQMIGADRDTPMVLFAHYTDTMDAIEAKLKELNVSYRRIDGSTKQTDRPGIERDFQSGSFQVLLGQMRAAGVSLNLQRANISVAFDFSYAAIDYAQAKRRTRRRGQLYDCYHWDLVANQMQLEIHNRIKIGLNFHAAIASYQSARNLIAARYGKPLVA